MGKSNSQLDNEYALLYALRILLSEQSLRMIASADWGYQEAVYDWLTRNCFERPIERIPDDVLECLVLETIGTPSRRMSQEQHVCRAVAAYLLLHEAAGHESPVAYAGVLARLVESAIALGADTTNACLQFAEWLSEKRIVGLPRSFVLLASLLLKVAQGQEHVDLDVDDLTRQWEMDLRELAPEIAGSGLDDDTEHAPSTLLGLSGT